jgi:transposase
MSLKPQAIEPIPDETRQVAQAAFPKGNPFMTMRDELGVFFEDAQFVALFAAQGPSGVPPWRLALVTVMQYAENLIRSPSRRCGAQSAGLEVCAGLGPDRCGV